MNVTRALATYSLHFRNATAAGDGLDKRDERGRDGDETDADADVLDEGHKCLSLAHPVLDQRELPL
jgi:hypothetical protein